MSFFNERCVDAKQDMTGIMSGHQRAPFCLVYRFGEFIRIQRIKLIQTLTESE